MKRLLYVALLVTCCVSCNPKELDRSDVRQAVQACGHHGDAVYCRAMQRLLISPIGERPGEISGEVTVLIPEKFAFAARTKLETEMWSTKWWPTDPFRRSAEYRRTAGNKYRYQDAFEQSAAGRAYAKANIFLAPSLHTGTLSTADGKTHSVVCHNNVDGKQECIIDGFLKGINQMQDLPNATGSVYKVRNVTTRPGPSGWEETTEPFYLPF